MSGGADAAKTQQFEKPLTSTEARFSALNLEAAREALDAFQKTGNFQDLIAAVGADALGDLTGTRDFLDTIPAEERAALTSAQVGAAGEGVGLLGDLSTAERSRLALGDVSALTPEQEARISEAERTAIEAGTLDIEAGQRDQFEMLREELAPRLGLRPGDTPIQDRGQRIATEGLRATGRLAANVRAQGAQSRLSLPLEERQVGLAERGFAGGLAQAATATAEAFRQRAFENRLQLTGTAQTGGLQLASTFNPVAAQSAQRPTVVTSSKKHSKSGGISSEKFKDLLGPLLKKEVLSAVRGIKLHHWKYKASLVNDPLDHMGPTAEDFKEAFKVGDGHTIDYLDAIGVLFGAVQALADEVSELKAAPAEG